MNEKKLQVYQMRERTLSDILERLRDLAYMHTQQILIEELHMHRVNEDSVWMDCTAVYSEGERKTYQPILLARSVDGKNIWLVDLGASTDLDRADKPYKRDLYLQFKLKGELQFQVCVEPERWPDMDLDEVADHIYDENPIFVERDIWHNLFVAGMLVMLEA